MQKVVNSLNKTLYLTLRYLLKFSFKQLQHFCCIFSWKWYFVFKKPLVVYLLQSPYLTCIREYMSSRNIWENLQLLTLSLYILNRRVWQIHTGHVCQNTMAATDKCGVLLYQSKQKTDEIYRQKVFRPTLCIDDRPRKSK